MSNIKAIIFDLNGVVIKSPKFSDIFCDKFNIIKEKFLPVFKEVMVKARQSKAGSTFCYWKPHLDQWRIELNEKQFFDFWFSSEKENVELTEFAKILKQQGMKLFVLSNNFTERTKYYDKNFPFLKELFEEIYYSWQTGFVKPDIRAYQKILSDYNLKPEECFYFDDSKENIEVASRLGIKSFLFEGVDSIKKMFQDSSFKIYDDIK